MIRKVYKIEHEAREVVAKGVYFAAKIASLTLGPSGRNSLLGREYQEDELTNDAKTTVNDIFVDDELMQLGVKRVKSVVNTTFDKGGDNTTTAANLFSSFTKLGMDIVGKPSGYSGIVEDPIKVRNDIHAAAIEICNEIDKDTQSIKTIEDMQKVAFAATENTEHAGMIALMFSVIGENGVVTYEDSYDEHVTPEVVEGFEIEAGLSSENLANSDDKTFRLDNPLILVTNETIDSKEQLSPVTFMLYQQGIKNLVVISDFFSKEALHSYIEAKIIGEFNIIAIKAPFFNKSEHMKDIAAALGAKFFDKEVSNVSSAQISDLGTVKRIIVSKDKTTFLKSKGDVKERVSEIKKEIKINKSKFDQEQLKKRLARLSGGVGVIKIGSETEGHTGYLKKKIMNGVNSVKSSLQGGAVKGGGLTLIEISDRLPKNLLAQAIRSPYEQIQKNAGGKLEIGDNVLDPAINIKAAIMTAAREAGDVLTIEFVNADRYEKPKDFKDDED